MVNFCFPRFVPIFWTRPPSRTKATSDKNNGQHHVRRMRKKRQSNYDKQQYRIMIRILIMIRDSDQKSGLSNGRSKERKTHRLEIFHLMVCNGQTKQNMFLIDFRQICLSTGGQGQKTKKITILDRLLHLKKKFKKKVNFRFTVFAIYFDKLYFS